MSTQDFRPFRVSALHERHQALGASMMNVEDWHLPANYGDSDREWAMLTAHCAIVDISPLQLFQVQGKCLDDWLTQLLSNGGDLPVGVCAEASGSIVMRLRHDRVLVRGDCAGQPISSSILDTAASISELQVVDISHGVTGIGVLGPSAWEAISMRTEAPVAPSQFPSRTGIQAGFAHVRGVLIHQDVTNGPVYELYVPRHFGLYVWQQMEDAVNALGGSPIGWESWSQYVGVDDKVGTSVGTDS